MKAFYFRSIPDDIHDYVTELATETGRTMTDVVIILLTRCRAEGVIVPRSARPVKTDDQLLPRRRLRGAEGHRG